MGKRGGGMGRESNHALGAVGDVHRAWLEDVRNAVLGDALPGSDRHPCGQSAALKLGKTFL